MINMPKCTQCGAYTRYKLCYSCYCKKKPRHGRIYIGEVTFPDGTKEIYTGQTKRPVRVRTEEHIKNIEKRNRKTYVGRAVHYKLLGSVYAKDRIRAEKAIKRLPRAKKIALAK